MSFLLDTDTCSAYLKNNQQVVSKVMLHFGGLHLSVVTVGELFTWARRASAPATRMLGLRDLLAASTAHDVDFAVADKFGEIRATGTSFDGAPTRVSSVIYCPEIGCG